MSTASKSRVSLVVTMVILVVAGSVAGLGTVVGSSPTAEDVTAQSDDPPEVAWNETFGQSGDDKLKAVVPADDGGYVLVGRTSTADGDADGWLVTVDSSGEREENRTFGGDGDDRFSDVVETDDGYLLIGWTASDDAGKQGWLVKVDESGAEQWNRTYGGPQWEGFWKATETGDDGFLVVGVSDASGWAIQVDEEGATQWNRTYSLTEGRTEFKSVTDADDGYLIAGWTTSADNESSGVAVQVNATGAEQWNQSYGTNDSQDRLWSVTRADDGDEFLLVGESGEGQQRAGWAVLVDDSGSVTEQTTVEETPSRFIGAIPTGGGFLAIGGIDGSGNGFDGLVMGLDDSLEPQWEVVESGSEWDMLLGGTAAEDGHVLVGETSSFGDSGQDGWIVRLQQDNETAVG